MTWLVLLLSLPWLYWTQGTDSAPALKNVGIERLYVPPDQIESWRQLSFSVRPLTPKQLDSRETLLVPGIAPREGLASPTRVPWINANGWRIRRDPTRKYAYELPAGRAALAAAEAAVYGADAVLQIDAGDLAAVGRMLTFLEKVPVADLPDVADIGVVDDGSPVSGEVMNLLSRRNLLFQVLEKPSEQLTINIKLGSKQYPVQDASDPSAFALKIRRQLTDDRRALRVYGSEVVICRLTTDGDRVRLHVINYGGRRIEGLRIRLRGAYREAAAYASGTGRVKLAEYVRTDDATEFSIPRMSTYAVVDLVPMK